jgi:hypothetical protein
MTLPCTHKVRRKKRKEEKIQVDAEGLVPL